MSRSVSYYNTSGDLLGYDEWREKHSQRHSPLARARYMAYRDSWYDREKARLEVERRATRAPESRSEAISGRGSEHTDPRDKSTGAGEGEQEQLI